MRLRPTLGIAGLLIRSSPKLLVSLLAIALVLQALLVTRAVSRFLGDRFGRWMVVVEMTADRNGTAKLYWNVGRGFNEADSETRRVRGGQSWRQLRFPVPREPLAAVRFDPLKTEGEVRIRRIDLRSGSGRVLATVDPDAIRPGTQIAVRERVGDGLRVVTAADANDPSLLLGPLGPPGDADGVGFPWLGLALLGGLGAGLFALRRDATEWVARIRVFRKTSGSLLGWIAVKDRPGVLSLAVGAALTAVLQAWLLLPLHQAMDLPLWDEASTMAGGAAFLAGSDLGHPPDSPLPILVYAGLVRLFGPAGAIFALHYLVKTSLAVVIFLFAARVSASLLVGFTLAMVWALAEFQLNFPILTYQASLFWFILGLLALERFPGVAFGCVLLAALTRLEYQFAAGVLVVLGAGLLIRRRGRLRFPSGRTWFAIAAVWGLVLFTVFHLEGWNAGTSRGWYAVQQHYALRLQVEGVFPGHNPFLEYPLITDRDFPEAGSLGQAFRVNPRALIDHVWWTIRRAPGEFLSLTRPFAGGGPGIGLVAMVGLLLGVTGLVTLARFPRRSPALLIRAGRRHRPILFAMGSGLLVIGPGLIVFAKAAYLLPLVPLGLALPGALQRVGNGCGPKRLNTFLAILAAAVMGWTVLTVPRPFVADADSRPVAETLSILKKALPSDRPAVLLGVAAGSYAGYLGPDRVVAIEPLDTIRGGSVDPVAVRFDRLVETHRPDLILVDANWRLSPYFDAEGFARLRQEGWTGEPVPGGVLLRP